MSSMRRFFLSILGFSQALILPDVPRAQAFEDDFCQLGGVPSCADNGCSAQGGECIATSGYTPGGEVLAGCICVIPGMPPPECRMVNAIPGGERFCADVGCPPGDIYSCDPGACVCLETHDFDDMHCQWYPDIMACVDYDCFQIGGLCVLAVAKYPDGSNHLGCHCRIPDGPGRGCGEIIDLTGGGLLCADFQCATPEFYECSQVPAPCECLCPAIPAEAQGMHWLSKWSFEWNPLVCATQYNVYRETDPLAACGSVACSYGTCLLDGLVDTTADDSEEPASGQVFYYMVTGSSPSGEGTMGFSPTGLERPNLFPCPAAVAFASTKARSCSSAGGSLDRASFPAPHSMP